MAARKKVGGNHGPAGHIKKTTRKKAPTAAQMRKKLSGLGLDSGKRSQIRAWLQENETAKQFVELWLKMALAGETGCSVNRLMEELRDEYDYPFAAGGSKHQGSFGLQMRRLYGERYDLALELTAKYREAKRSEPEHG